MLRLKKLIKKIYKYYKITTWKNRSLPDFIIIGAQKAGTTSLFEHLAEHPEIIPPNRKEIHFFDGGLEPGIDTYKKGEKWYRAHFPLKSELKSNKTFEASPLYLFNPLAAERISKMLPDVKLIVLLRNPVDRAVSQYFHENRNNFDDKPVLEAMKLEEERLKPVIENKDYKSKVFIKHSYKSRGLYKEQLERYFSFFPKKNILILNSEFFFRNPGETLKEVLGFIGVDENYEFKDLKPRNTGYNKTGIEEEAHAYLKDYFKKPNEDLYALIGKKFDW